MNELRVYARYCHTKPVAMEGASVDCCIVNAMKEIDLRFVRGSGLNMSMYAVADYAAASNDRSSASVWSCNDWLE